MNTTNYNNIIYTGNEVYDIFGIKTNTILDNMFYKFKDGKLVSLNGIPSNSLLHLTGVSDTGKSLLCYNLAVNYILNKKMIFITIERNGKMLNTLLSERAKTLNIEYKRENIFILDLTKSVENLQNLDLVINTIIEITKKENTRFIIIDSITGFYEHLENKARTVVRRLYNVLKAFNYTGIAINQKRSSHEDNTAEGAGGYAVAHIFDGSIVMSKKTIKNKWEEEDYGVKRGNTIRFIRIDGCKLALHPTKEFVFKINPNGTLEIIKEVEKEG